VFGVKVIVEGDICTDPGVVYVGNHISYLDIVSLGSIVKGCFVAKKEIESWPFFGLMAKQQRTVFINRDPKHAAQETQMLLSRLKEPLPLMIFPEGTSSNGKQILPFKTAFFEIFLNHNFKMQPFTFSVMEIDGHTTISDMLRDEYTWHGDMDLVPCLWTFSKKKGAIVKIVFQEPILSSSFSDRKQLCAVIYEGVVKGLDLSSSPSYGHNLPAKEDEQQPRRQHASNTR
jgi:1-acyl-sn-glycerol-3-phosphate acyltransferase